MDGPTPRGLHRFAVALSVGIVGLIAAGGLVKSLEAGLAVPDWPTSYGGLNPPRWWEIENVRAEHGHRLIAGTIAVATVLLAVWARLREPRRWARRLAYAAVVAVLIQALLGGITVLFFLPTAVSVSHAALAQLYLCLVVAFAVVTSTGWRERRGALGFDPLRPLAAFTAAAVYGQVLLGALVRHTGAGLAIPDFPTMFGGWWPSQMDPGIGVHLAHRGGALVVTALVLLLAARLWRSGTALRPLVVAMLALLVTQVMLGASIIWTARAVLPNTLHVPVGACLLTTAWIATLVVWRRSAPLAVEGPGVSDRAVVTA